MTGAARMPTWKERENNKRRERRRRAVAARIFAGLRRNGNYNLSKHSNNNDVLKALCHEAGWTVEPDGTTYRKGNTPVENMDFMGGSSSASPYTSYNPSPVSSTCAPSITTDGNSFIPWLRNLSSSSSTPSSSSSKFIYHYMHGSGSISAPVTPPMSSPTAGTPRMETEWEKTFARPGWGPHPFLPLSTPPSPARQVLPDFAFPTSPAFSLVSSNPFCFGVENLTPGGSLMCTPGQSGTCSPAAADIPMAEVIPNEFAFGSNAARFVKPWEGERIHEECGSDDLELTLGGSKARY